MQDARKIELGKEQGIVSTLSVCSSIAVHQLPFIQI